MDKRSFLLASVGSVLSILAPNALSSSDRRVVVRQAQLYDATSMSLLDRKLSSIPKRDLELLLAPFVGQPNDAVTRTQLVDVIQSYVDRMQTTHGIRVKLRSDDPLHMDVAIQPLRQVEVERDGQWVQTTMDRLTLGDTFRMFEGSTPVLTQGQSQWVARSMPFKIEGVWGITI